MFRTNTTAFRLLFHPWLISIYVEASKPQSWEEMLLSSLGSFFLWETPLVITVGLAILMVLAISHVRIEIVNALAKVPKETTNFWKFLYNWGGTWMWEGIDKDQTTKDNVTWIAEGMRNNTLIWVTDGSYDRKKAKELSRAGWIIFCTKTGL